MIEDAGDLGKQHPDVLCPLGNIAVDPQQPFGAEREGMLHTHRRDVIQPVEIGQRLQVRLVLDQLLGAAVQQPDMRVGALHHLALHLQDEAQDAVRGRMLRPEIDRVAVDLDLVRRQLGGGDAHGATPPAGGLGASIRFRCTFSSPGRVVIASQGDMKSKSRKSWVSETGSYTTCLRSSS